MLVDWLLNAKEAVVAVAAGVEVTLVRAKWKIDFELRWGAPRSKPARSRLA